MINRFSQGAPITKPPFGYKMVNKKLEINQETAPKLKFLFEEFLESSDSLNKLARRYNLTVNGLKKILTNRTYLGDIKFDGEVSRGIHQPLITEDMFSGVQEKISSFQKNKKEIITKQHD